MHSIHSPADLTPEQRLHEIAAILARGVLRLQKRRILSPAEPLSEISKSPATGLELPRESRLSGSTG